ncbi:tryptophan 7-halogenase [Sphingomonas oligophenolica]|uniref:tryptophan halogenase family protein n=1 Tax=Sphingomonas oligophenolica TaxID=301154 RepID=UPI0031D1260F
MSMPGIETVAILGGSVAGWMAAATLARRLPRQRYRVILIETAQDGDGLGDFGTTLTSLPSIKPFHESLGIDESLLLRATRGSFALGVAFSGMATRDSACFLPFGAIGAPIGPVAFHQLLTRLRQQGRDVRAADYSIAAIAAQAGRFTRPSADQGSTLSQFSYGLHLDAWGYLAALRATAEAHGARAAAAPFGRALIGENGDVAGIELADGEIVPVMLAIDATGAPALLSGVAIGGGFESWRHWLPCDQSAALRVADPGDPLPFSHVEAMATGWHGTTPLAGEVGRLVCWSSAFGDADTARTALGVADGPDPHMVAFENGRRALPWHRNVVAIGAAACVIEPLHPVALHLVQSALARLVTLFPASAHAPVEAAEYNRMTINELERTRDFLIAHYATNRRAGDPFWDAVLTSTPPERVLYKLQMFASAGRMPMFDDEMFEEEDWIALLDAQGLHPRRHNALSGAVPIERIEQHLARLREAIIAAVKTMPRHGDYLRRAHAATARGAAA